MLTEQKIDSPEQALEILNSILSMDGITGVVGFLGRYASEAIIAEGQDETEEVRNNCLYLTHAINALEDNEIKTPLLRIWLQMSTDAIAASQMANMIQMIMGRLNKSLDPVESMVESLKEKAETANLSELDIYPLGVFCETFQTWAVDAEEAICLAAQTEADVTVYKLMGDRPEALCMVIAQAKPKAEDAPLKSFKILLPYDCLADEAHFADKHLEDIKTKFDGFLATL